MLGRPRRRTQPAGSKACRSTRQNFLCTSCIPRMSAKARALRYRLPIAGEFEYTAIRGIFFIADLDGRVSFRFKLSGTPFYAGQD
jgi:hypothetical protein